MLEGEDMKESAENEHPAKKNWKWMTYFTLRGAMLNRK